MRWVRLAVLGVATAFSSPALACTCMQYDALRAVMAMEVIIDGVVIEREPHDELRQPDAMYSATMRVEKVWKGDVGPLVTLIYNEGEAACGAIPPLGRKIRVGSSLSVPGSEIFYGLCREMEFDGAQIDAVLVAYKSLTDEFMARAKTGNYADRIAFAQHLRRYREFGRALRVYQSLLEENPSDLDLLLASAILHGPVVGFRRAEELIAQARMFASDGPETRGKIARATFEALGKLDPQWHDWSGLENLGHCAVSSLDLSDRNFDGSRLVDCNFVGSTLRNASFRGANLAASFLEEADASGARFDCATKFRSDFDPIAAGMVSIEGECPEPPGP